MVQAQCYRVTLVRDLVTRSLGWSYAKSRGRPPALTTCQLLIPAVSRDMGNKRRNVISKTRLGKEDLSR